MSEQGSTIRLKSHQKPKTLNHSTNTPPKRPRQLQIISKAVMILAFGCLGCHCESLKSQLPPAVVPLSAPTFVGRARHNVATMTSSNGTLLPQWHHCISHVLTGFQAPSCLQLLVCRIFNLSKLPFQQIAAFLRSTQQLHLPTGDSVCLANRFCMADKVDQHLWMMTA